MYGPGDEISPVSVPKNPINFALFLSSVICVSITW